MSAPILIGGLLVVSARLEAIWVASGNQGILCMAQGRINTGDCASR
jgi:hypothetical protein